MVKINPQGVSLGIVANHIGGTVIDDKIGERKIKQFPAKNRLRKDLRESAIYLYRNLRLAINRYGDSVHRAGDDAHATVDTLLLIHVHRRPNGNAVILQNSRYVRESFFGANDRANLAADAFIQVPGH